MYLFALAWDIMQLDYTVCIFTPFIIMLRDLCIEMELTGSLDVRNGVTAIFWIVPAVSYYQCI